jgi:hypothetical protein
MGAARVYSAETGILLGLLEVGPFLTGEGEWVVRIVGLPVPWRVGNVIVFGGA